MEKSIALFVMMAGILPLGPFREAAEQEEREMGMFISYLWKEDRLKTTRMARRNL